MVDIIKNFSQYVNEQNLNGNYTNANVKFCE